MGKNKLYVFSFIVGPFEGVWIQSMKYFCLIVIMIFKRSFGTDFIFAICLIQRGAVHEYNQEYPEAKNCYDNALAINPSHIKTMQGLGAVLLCLEQYEMAEKVLRDAVNIDPTAHMSWWVDQSFLLFFKHHY